MGALVSCAALTACECACCCACACCKTIIGGTLAQMARIGHIALVISLFVFAIILGKKYPNEINGYKSYTEVDLEQSCNPAFNEECIYRQLIYRASFTLFLIFGVIAACSMCSTYVNKSFWMLKFGAAFSIFIGFWWGENNFFSGFAEFARFLSFAWLLVQALILFDFAHDCHDIIMAKSDEAEREHGDGAGRGWLGFYLLLSLGNITAGMVGIVYLYQNFTACDLGAFFTSVTLIFGFLTTVISLLNVINKGLLTPSIMFAYSVFMCWYALLSNPNSECNSSADHNGTEDKKTAVVIISIITFVVLLYCALNGTVILNIFNPEGEGVMQSQIPTSKLTSVLRGEETGTSGVTISQPTTPPPAAGEEDDSEGISTKGSSGTLHEIVFFHILMMLMCCYGAMILTSWGKTYGAPEGYGSDETANISMWLKILSQWVFLAMQCRVLQLAYEDNA